MFHPLLMSFVNAEDPRRRFETSTSVDVDTYIFSGIRRLLTGLHHSKYDFEFPIKQFHLLGILRAPDVRSPIPDRALCTIMMRRLKIPPVCTFEMKGPSESFAKPVQDCFRRKLMVADGDCEEEIDEIVRGFCRGRRCEHEISSQALCLLFNTMFGAYGQHCESSMVFSKKLTLMIAQTLVQALTSSSGCGFLYTYETGIAFELVDLSNYPGGRQKIRVRTSSLYCCGNQKGAAAALLTMSNYAVKKLSEDKPSMNRIGEFAKIISDAADSREDKKSEGTTNDGDVPDPSQLEGPGNESENNARGAPADGNSTNAHTANVTNSKPGTQSTPQCVLPTYHESYKEPSPGKNTDIITQSVLSDITEDLSASHNFDAEHLLNSIYREMGLMLGTGASGTVLQGDWQGRRVALKIWNGEDEGGLLELCKEAEVYEFMKATSPSLFGTVVSNVVLTLNKCNRRNLRRSKVGLVTEYVGKGLTRDVRGRLWLCEENESRSTAVRLEDEHDICQAALKSLMSLHRSEILHGDIGLRNLRVEQLSTSCGKDFEEFTWKAYWIDFGKACFGADFTDSASAIELYECTMLFENVSDIRSSLRGPVKRPKRITNSTAALLET